MTQQINLTMTADNLRLDKALQIQLVTYSRSQIQQWIKAQRVMVNGQTARSNYQVRVNDQVEIYLPEPEVLAVTPEALPLAIVYEDEDVVVINKPQGMVVHPSAGHLHGTLVNALLHHVRELSTINDVVRPGIVHRIDKDTSGLLMVAKNDFAHAALASQLKEKTTVRKYLALVHGKIAHEQGVIDAPIGRSKQDRKKQAVVEDGKSAVTHFTVLERFDDFTLVALQLETGRTHQIRVHMQYIGYPLAGDPIYGPKKTLRGNGQFLHAATLGFHHPKTGELMLFHAPLPEIFEKTLVQLRNKS